MKFYNLEPTNGRASFYGKAVVNEYNNNVKILKSYNCPVCLIDKNGIHRICDEISNTTGVHILSFSGLNKKDFLNLKVEDMNKLLSANNVKAEFND